MNFILVFIGGGLGSVLRFMIGLAFQKFTFQLPIATLCANITASLIFALLAFTVLSKNSSQHLQVLLLTGFCGGLSTFSTFGYENFILLKAENYTWMFINIALSLILSIGSFMLIKKVYEI